MLIGIDISPAAKKNKTGVEWYCYHIANELTKLDATNQYRFYTKTPVAHEFERFPSNFTEVVIPDRSYWTHTSLAMELKNNPVDVFYSPGHIIPWCHPKRTVSTIHDAGFRHYRQNYSPYQYMHAVVNTRLSARWSKTIIVPAQFVADDIATIYNLKGKKISVVHNGFDPKEFQGITASDIESAKIKYGVTKPYFIFVGRMEIRKNIVRALRAFFDLVEKRGEEFQFVLIGSPAVGFEEIDNFIKSQKRADLVIRPGYVSSKEKSSLMSGAKGLVFPTLYEGFGIPILEGFAAGVPVLTSNITSCPEIAGNAAIIIDPHNVDDIRKGMESMLDDEALCKELVAKGYERAKLFSWEIMTRAVHKLLLEGV